MTIRNGLGIGLGIMYGKKVVTTVGRSVVGQLGNSRLERGIDTAKMFVGYIGIVIAEPTAAPITLPLAIGVDVITNMIDNAVESHATTLDNERTMEERGTIMQLGAGGYYG